jgi:outer membrane murein-binding lipoprotein Lpp
MEKQKMKVKKKNKKKYRGQINQQRDEAFNNLQQKYSKLKNQRKELEEKTNEMNPQILALNSEIDNLKSKHPALSHFYNKNLSFLILTEHAFDGKVYLHATIDTMNSFKNENTAIKKECEEKDAKIDNLHEEVKSLTAKIEENDQTTMYSLDFNSPYEEIEDKLSVLKSYLTSPNFKYDPLVYLFQTTITPSFLSTVIPPYKPSQNRLSRFLSMFDSPLPTPIETYSKWASNLGSPSFSSSPVKNIRILIGQKSDSTWWVYFGETVEGVAEGRGSRVDGKGGVYVGEWKEGEMTGKGRKIYETED